MAFKGLLSVFALLGFALFSSEGAQAALRFDANVPVELRQQIEKDLSFVKSMQGEGATQNYQKIFLDYGIYGQSLLNFFEERIASVGLDDCGGGGASACVMPERDSNKMWLAPGYSRFDMPQVYRLSVIFHEARHSEDSEDNWPHEICPTPYRDEQGNDIKGIFSGMPMAGLPACDVNVWGSYGLQATLLKNIARFCANCSEKVKQDATLYGDDTILRISRPAERAWLRDDLK